jgi:AcrR family transcriptional regulator
MMRNSDATRRRILAAAADLFYGDGIRATSLDAIAARAKVTKRTLYYHFRSKDDLIAAYLAAADEPTLTRYVAWIDAIDGSPARQIVGVFEKLGRVAAKKQWKGCGFLRAAAEFAATPGHPALKMCSLHKQRFEAWLTSRIAATGLSRPALRARQLMVLLDGAVTELLLHRDTAYAEAAALAAEQILKP